MKSDQSLVVQIAVPVYVPEDSRADFERATVEFLLGHDRLRPELASRLAAEGVDVDHLNALSVPARVGACPDPEAHEFIPDAELSSWASERGISFTDGGQVSFAFDYDADAAGDPRELKVGFHLPAQAGELTSAQMGSVVRGLFGDCSLAEPAQKYLLANGIDAVRFARSNSDAFASTDTPMTTRVGPETERLLKELGLKTDTFGQLKVISINQLERDGDTVPIWSKSTCC